MKFKPGDLVWYKRNLRSTEVPDVVGRPAGLFDCEEHPGHQFWFLLHNFACCSSQLRPRDPPKQDWETLCNLKDIKEPETVTI